MAMFEHSPYAPHIPFPRESRPRFSSFDLDPVRVCTPCPQLKVTQQNYNLKLNARANFNHHLGKMWFVSS